MSMQDHFSDLSYTLNSYFNYEVVFGTVLVFE